MRPEWEGGNDDNFRIDHSCKPINKNAIEYNPEEIKMWLLGFEHWTSRTSAAQMVDMMGSKDGRTTEVLGVEHLNYLCGRTYSNPQPWSCTCELMGDTRHGKFVIFTQNAI